MYADFNRLKNGRNNQRFLIRYARVYILLYNKMSLMYTRRVHYLRFVNTRTPNPPSLMLVEIFEKRAHNTRGICELFHRITFASFVAVI